MKTRFDWHSEDLTPEEHARFSGSTLPSGKKRRYLIPSSMLLIIVIAVTARTLLVRQSHIISAVEADVVRAFELQYRAAESGDEELFSDLLSASDLKWKRNQQQLLNAQIFNERHPLGLAPIAGSTAQVQSELSPDLRQAELTYVQTYVGEEARLELLHRLIYTREDGRWFNARPSGAFWGPQRELERDLFHLTYPSRDSDLAVRFADRIEARLSDLCAQERPANVFRQRFCAGELPWRIKLSLEEGALLDFAEMRPTSSDYDFELPTPTLVGVPAADQDAAIFLDYYTRNLLGKMEETLLSEDAYPEQSIYALCFDHPQNGRHLYRYDWPSRIWQQILPSQTFQHLSALPHAAALFLADNESVTVIEQAHQGGPEAIWRRNWPAATPPGLLGWIRFGTAAYHLQQELPANGGPPEYSALDLEKCDAQDCDLARLPGYPVPSPSGDRTLFVNGSQIRIGSPADDRPGTTVEGHNPFWMDEDTYGYIRFSGDVDSGLTTQVVLDTADEENALILLDGKDLARSAKEVPEGSVFINAVIPNPADPNRLLIASSGIREYAGHYFLFSVDMIDRKGPQPDLQIKLELLRSGNQGGVPGLMTPTGPPPFLVSANGRWLAMTELSSQESDTWTVLIHDLRTGDTIEIRDRVPAMPGNFPLLAWSADGRWLLVADRDYIQLIAPQDGHQVLVGHEFDACSHIVWGD